MLRVEAQFADHLDTARPRLYAVKLDPLLRVVTFHAIQPLQEVEVPPRSTELSIRHDCQTEIFLFCHRQTDLLVFNFP
ncbi:hypothetical protein D3C80_1256200 [compost metagenome]